MLHRVAELADRPAGYRPPGAPGFTNLVQLPQIVAEIVGTGPKSKKVGAEVSRLVAALGPELSILTEIGTDDLRRAGGVLLADAVGRLRRGEVRREAGYDGEYGVVALFGPGELDRADALFDLAIPEQAASQAPAAQRVARSAGDTDGTKGASGEATAGGEAEATTPPRRRMLGGAASSARRARPRAARGGDGRQPADDHRRAGDGQDPYPDPPDRR